MEFIVKKPIPGFEDINKIKLQKINDTFAILKDNNDNVLFTLVNPFMLRKDYDFEVPADVRVLLNLNENSDVEVYCNVIMKDPIQKLLLILKHLLFLINQIIQCPRLFWIMKVMQK
jgi:flagellar assembly factor FliW